VVDEELALRLECGSLEEPMGGRTATEYFEMSSQGTELVGMPGKSAGIALTRAWSIRKTKVNEERLKVGHDE
jgi:hypothetical protein